MSLFRRRHHDERSDYEEDLAAWQIRHGADHRDMTPAQDRRMRQHSVMLNAGLDVERLAAVRWAFEHGRLSDGN